MNKIIDFILRTIVLAAVVLLLGAAESIADLILGM